MCNHCEIHRSRAAQERALSQTDDATARRVHLDLAELHDRRRAEYETIHGMAGQPIPGRERTAE